MKKLIINSYVEVMEYNSLSGDWSGEQFTKQVDLSPVVLSEITAESIAKGLSSQLSKDIKPEDLFFDESGNFVSITENGEGYPDENGSYLVDYSYSVIEEQTLNLIEVL